MNEDPIREEIESHIEQRRAWLSARGEDPKSARRIFGNTGLVYEDTRRVHVPGWLDAIARDVRYAWRSYRRTPVFTFTALAVLTIGLGSGAAVFGVVDRILFRPLPYADGSRLVWMGMRAPLVTGDEFVLGSDYQTWRRTQQAFTVMTSFQGRSDCKLQMNEPVLTGCASVEWNFLPALGLDVQRGRGFAESDGRVETPPVALISDAIWRQQFGGGDSAVGTKVLIDGRLTEIAGVLPASFELPTLARPSIVLAQKVDWASQVRGQSTIIMQAVGRLKPGVSIQQAESMMQPLLADAMQFVPERFRKEVTFHLLPLRERQVRGARQASVLLLGAVACLLLIGCLNVANLFAARMESRRHELMTRAALGAQPLALARQLLVESLLLGTGGIAGGLALGWILLRAAIALSPDGLPRLSQASIDPRVTLAIATCGLLSAIGAGLWPALTGGRQDWRSGQRTTSQSTAWFRQVLIAFQIAASLTLLTGAGLLTRSLLQLQQVPLGLRTAGAYTTPLVMDRERYQLPGKRSSFIRQLEQLAVHTPGVAAAAVSDSIPPAGAAAAMIFSNIGLEGKAAIPQGTGGMVLHRFVSPGYFAALGIPILRGRAFVPQDSASGDVLIVNESAAAKMFPGEDALGKRVKLPQRGPWLSIVGISANARNNGLQGTSDPEYYEPWTDRSQTRAAHLTIRTPLGPAAAREILRTTVWQLDPTIPVEVQSLESRVDALRVQPRFQAAVLGFFALSGLVIAAVGLYGVISYLVARRTREIGVRLAVGASPGRILRMLLGQAAVWIGAGIGLGLMAAFFLGQVIEKLLFGVQPRDPATMAASALVLLTAAFTAIWLPARRAARLDPTLALGAD